MKPIKIRRITFLQLFNLPKSVANHMLGEDHPVLQRIIIGIFVMVIGVTVSKVETTIWIINIFTEGFGYTIHAIGAIPVLEYVTGFSNARKAKAEQEKEEIERE